MGMWRDSLRKILPIGSCHVEIQVVRPRRGAAALLHVSAGGVLSEGYGHDEPGVCLGDGQTESYLKDMGMAGLASA